MRKISGLENRKNRIRRNVEIQTLFEKGKRIRGKSFDLVFQENKGNTGRAGIVVGKKCGIAAERNRIKRIFREILFNRDIKLDQPFDFLLIPKKADPGKKFDILQQEVKKILEQMIRFRGQG